MRNLDVTVRNLLLQILRILPIDCTPMEMQVPKISLTIPVDKGIDPSPIILVSELNHIIYQDISSVLHVHPLNRLIFAQSPHQHSEIYHYTQVHIAFQAHHKII